VGHSFNPDGTGNHITPEESDGSLVGRTERSQ
jgi:hypothetical protein